MDRMPEISDGGSSGAPLPTSRRQGGRPRTIPEQVADDLAVAIMQGQYRAGERVLEQEISELYGVSRGPVREAIRALEKRGLVEFFPRRGAYVVGVSLDLFADLFNVRAALIGMAARCLAVSAPQDALEDLTRRITQLKSCTAALDPMAFATEVGGVTRALYSRCGNVPLGRILHDQQENSLWGLVWRAQALDFHTLERRQQSAQDWSAVASAIGAGNANKAERLTREAMARSRNMALSTLAQLKGETVHPDKLFKDGNVSR